MAKEAGPSQRRSGSSSSVTKRGKDDRRKRDKKVSKTSHTVNIADKNKPNNKSTVVVSKNNIKITPPKVLSARTHHLRARPADQIESVVQVSELQKQQLEELGYILSNIIGKDGGSVKFRAHYLHKTDTFLLRQKRHLWCKAINSSNEDLISDLKSRELKILSKLNHPNVAALHGLIHLNEKIFMFTTGGMYGSVLDFLANYGPIYENHGRVWFRQIVNGLEYLHCNNIAHNDLNCETLMLSNQYSILLSDFSSACYLTEGGKRVLSNSLNNSLYSAPEVLLGEDYNPKVAEMWSLGVILYAFYMGHPPFRYYGTEDEQLARLVIDQIQQIWLRKRRNQRKLSNHAWQVICSLLEPDNLKRVQMRHLKNTEFYIMRECVCGHGSYKAMSQEILSSLPHVYTSTKSLPKWVVEIKNDLKNKVVCPLIKQYFSPRQDLMLKIEDAESIPPVPTGVTPFVVPDIVINIEDPI